MKNVFILTGDGKTAKELPTGDSMALTLGSWIGVPAVPFVTLFKIEVRPTRFCITTGGKYRTLKKLKLIFRPL